MGRKYRNSLIGTSAISQDIERLLKELIEQDVRVDAPEQIRWYLLNFPDVIDVVPVAVRAAHEYLPQAQLVLRVYHDPEIEDSYLTLYARLKEYDKEVLGNMERAESKFLDLLADKSGWLQLTTDFQRPDAPHAL